MPLRNGGDRRSPYRGRRDNLDTAGRAWEKEGFSRLIVEGGEYPLPGIVQFRYRGGRMDRGTGLLAM